jgi:Family of unknown function (DUF6263)
VLAGTASAQVTLRYQFKEGEKLDYVMDQDQKMSMSVGGQDIEMKVNMAMDLIWQTEKVDADGNAKVKLKFGRVKMSMNGPMGKVEVDSNDTEEPDDPAGRIFAQVVKAIGGMEMSFTMDPRGEMKDVQVADAALKKLKNLPGVDKLGDMLSPDSMKSMMGGNMVLPKEPVEKGKSWTQKTDQKTPFGKVVGETKYTYEGDVDRGGKKLEKIALKPDVKIEPDPNAPAQIKVKGGSGKGYSFFDNKAGKITETINETTMQMEVEAGGMTINMDLVQTTTVRLKGAAKGSERPPR